MLIFLLKFSMLLILSGIFINSWHYLSRHYIVINPDNSETVSGEALKFWSQFFEKVKRVDRLYYSGDAMAFKFSELNRLFPNIWERLEYPNGNCLILKKDAAILTTDEILRVETVLQCKVEAEEHAHVLMYQLYIEDTVYWFPDIIRKPFSACPKCMASVFGSAIWLTINYLDSDLFLWCSHPLKGFFAFWLIFLLTLSWLSNFINSKA